VNSWFMFHRGCDRMRSGCGKETRWQSSVSGAVFGAVDSDGSSFGASIRSVGTFSTFIVRNWNWRSSSMARSTKRRGWQSTTEISSELERRGIALLRIERPPDSRRSTGWRDDSLRDREAS